MVLLAENNPPETLFPYEPQPTQNLFQVTGGLMPTLKDLHQAIRFRDIPKVEALVDCSSVKLNSSIRSCTALSVAVYQGDLQIVKILLSKGAEVDKFSRDWNHRIETPLLSASRLARVDIAQILIENGADVNCTDFYNRSPLWIATRERNFQLVQILVLSGADLNIADKWSQCPLYLASKYYGREIIANLLIRHGCKLDMTDVQGRGAFYWSLVNGLVETVKLLVKAGVYISKTDREHIFGRNPTNIIQEKPELAQFLRHELANPSSLSRICVKGIRRQIGMATSRGTSIWPHIDILPVPDAVKSKLKLQ